VFPTAEDPTLIRPCDIRGLLHSHTQYGDGVHPLRRMVETAIDIGLEYLGVNDHYVSMNHPDGLDVDRELAQEQEIAQLRAEFPEFDILHGLELDAEPDGTLDAPDDLLRRMDYVLVSLPVDSGSQDRGALTQAALRLVENPLVNIFSKPVGDYMLRRPPLPLDLDEVLRAAAVNDTVIEIDANPHTLEVDHHYCQEAAQAGVKLVINTNAHRAARLVDFRTGVAIAREARLCCDCLVNTRSADDLRSFFRAKRG